MFSERLEAWLRRHAVLWDVALALTLAVPFVLPYVLSGQRWTATVSALLTLPLALRRRAAVTSAVIVLSSALLQWLTIRDTATQLIPADISILIAVYSVTAYGPRWARPAALAAGLIGSALGGELWPSDPGTRPTDHVLVGVAFAVTIIAVWSFGMLRGVRLEQLESLRERARLLEVERDQRAQLAVSAERARIAREMHDVVAHSLAVMIAQADGGRYAATDSPAAQGVLQTIGETGREALAEMRRLLAVLREEGAEGAAEAALLPQPGLGDLPTLVERARAGGLRIDLEEEGVPVPVDAGLGLVAYRIVQEGLTNVIKHAGPAASATVTLRWQRGALAVDVLDDGRGAGAPLQEPGHGLVGMRERAAAYGGTVEAGPRLGGGFAVRAVIPVVPVLQVMV
jgi:signal transduction histidine kinase